MDKYPETMSEVCVETDGGSCENSERSKRKNAENEIYNITSLMNRPMLRGIREKRGRSISRPNFMSLKNIQPNHSGIWGKQYESKQLWNSPKPSVKTIKNMKTRKGYSFLRRKTNTQKANIPRRPPL
jgi:hypothetical protein